MSYIASDRVRVSRKLSAFLLNELEFLEDDPDRARRIQDAVARWIERSGPQTVEPPRAEGES